MATTEVPKDVAIYVAGLLAGWELLAPNVEPPWPELAGFVAHLGMGRYEPRAIHHAASAWFLTLPCARRREALVA